MASKHPARDAPASHAGDTGTDAPRLRRRLASLRDIASLVNSGGDLGAMLEHIAYAVCRHADWAMSGIMSVDERAGMSVRVAGYDPFTDQHAGLPRDRWPLTNSPIPRVVAERRPVVILDAAADEAWPGFVEDACARNYHTTVIVPLGAEDTDGRAMALSVQAREVRAVSDDDIAFLQAVAHQAGLAVRNARRLDAEQRTAARLQAAFTMHSELMQAVLNDASMERLFEHIESLLSTPMLVVDATANVIHGARSTNLDHLGVEGFGALLATSDGAAFLLNLVRQAPATGLGPVREMDFSPIGADFCAHVLVEPLLVEGRLLGGLFVFSGAGGLDDLQALAVSEAKFALAVHLMRSHARFASAAELRADLLSRLFSGDWRHASEVVTRAGYLGINLQRPARLLVLHADDAAAGQACVDLSWQHRRLARAAERLWPGARVVIDRDDWVVFLPGDLPPERARAGVERLRGECEALFGESPLIALSATCTALGDYAEARHACARSLSMGRALGRTGLLADEDLGAGAVLLDAVADEQVRRFVANTLEPLQAHDRAHRGALLQTLAAYLHANCRPTATAERLGVHVTTLRYRLHRIQEVGAVDLDDPEQRFALQLALRLRALLPADAAL